MAQHRATFQVAHKDCQHMGTISQLLVEWQYQTLLVLTFIRGGVIYHNLLKKDNEAIFSNPRLFKCSNCKKMFILLGNLSRHILIHTEFKPSWNLAKNSRLVEATALNKGCWLSESTQCLGSDVPLAMLKWSHMTFYCQRITKEYKVSSLFCWTEYRVVLPPPLLYLCPF